MYLLAIMALVAHTPQSRAKAMAKMQAIRDRWFHEAGPCYRCGSTHQLELHHLDPQTKVSHRVWSWSLKRRLVELAKCRPICRSCHMAIHSLLRRQSHGAAAYRRGCRCEVCKAARSVQSARYRQRHPRGSSPSKSPLTDGKWTGYYGTIVKRIGRQYGGESQSE